MPDVGIRALGAYIPEGRLTNEDLARMVETSDEWIVERTGISERRIAPREMPTSHMAAQAAARAVEASALDPAELRFVISSTATPERTCPTVAAKVAQSLALSNSFTFDLNAACSGFVYGLTLGMSLLRTEGGKFGLVTASEKMSAFTDYTDRASCILFGDGAGAAIITTEPPFHRILDADLGADPAGADMVLLGGRQVFGTGEQGYFWQDGRGVFRFAVNKLKEMFRWAGERMELTGDRFHIIPHQANGRMVENVGKELGIPAERFVSNIGVRGNTSSASIPIAMAEAEAEGRFKPGDRLLLLGFGGGLTWGSMIVEW